MSRKNKIRNRVTYQSEAIYVSKEITSTVSGDHIQLDRIQNANYNFTIRRTNINQYSRLSSIDSIVIESPTVNLDFSYYLTDGFNEKALGFYVQDETNTQEANFTSGHLISSSGKNVFITTAAEGVDAQGEVGNDIESVIGIGNAYLSNYGLELAVGNVPMVSVSMECANINSTTAPEITGDTAITGIATPAINVSDGIQLSGSVELKPATSGSSSITVLRPGDVTVNIENFNGQTISNLSGADAINIQSASLSIPLSRSAIQRIGSKFPFARTVDLPATATLSINAIATDLTARNLANVINDSDKKNVILTLKDSNSITKMIYTLKNCVLVSESFTSSIGSNKSVDLVFSTQIGGPNDQINGVFVSGNSNTNLPISWNGILNDWQESNSTWDSL